MPYTTLNRVARRWRVLLLASLLLAGPALMVWQPVGIPTLMAWGASLAGHPGSLPVVAAMQALLFTFALPGSTLVWLVAPFHPPAISVPVLVAGSTGGALGARLVAHRLARGVQTGGRSQSVIRILEQRGDLFTQIALRALPGFPHSLVNYAGGVLKLPLRGYIAAAVIGLSCKWWVYSGAIHGISTAARGKEAIGAASLVPLLALAVLMLAAAVIRSRLSESR